MGPGGGVPKWPDVFSAAPENFLTAMDSCGFQFE